MKCKGRNLDDHCCWFNSKPCQFLEENTEPGFRWSCGLRRELGSWDAVIADNRYKKVVAPEYRRIAKRLNAPVADCRDWPSDPYKCSHCGANT